MKNAFKFDRNIWLGFVKKYISCKTLLNFGMKRTYMNIYITTCIGCIQLSSVDILACSCTVKYIQKSFYNVSFHKDNCLVRWHNNTKCVNLYTKNNEKRKKTQTTSQKIKAFWHVSFKLASQYIMLFKFQNRPKHLPWNTNFKSCSGNTCIDYKLTIISICFVLLYAYENSIHNSLQQVW